VPPEPILERADAIEAGAVRAGVDLALELTGSRTWIIATARRVCRGK
jgi:hypothetical protein